MTNLIAFHGLLGMYGWTKQQHEHEPNLLILTRDQHRIEIYDHEIAAMPYDQAYDMLRSGVKP